ncbi:hypothetical protein, partial [Amycolatopsis sp. NPDC000740]|uniref:hypothetical protein n=1 Tax=Amycolatopsis sp. NPDC000740 TaxID=3154269 RepID=UPI003320ED66
GRGDQRPQHHDVGQQAEQQRLHADEHTIAAARADPAGAGRTSLSRGSVLLSDVVAPVVNF